MQHHTEIHFKLRVRYIFKVTGLLHIKPSAFKGGECELWRMLTAESLLQGGEVRSSVQASGSAARNTKWEGA